MLSDAGKLTCLHSSVHLLTKMPIEYPFHSIFCNLQLSIVQHYCPFSGKSCWICLLKLGGHLTQAHGNFWYLFAWWHEFISQINQLLSRKRGFTDLWGKSLVLPYLQILPFCENSSPVLICLNLYFYFLFAGSLRREVFCLAVFISSLTIHFQKLMHWFYKNDIWPL